MSKFAIAKENIFYPTDFLCTIGQPQPRDVLQLVKVTVNKNNNKTDIWLIFFIIKLILYP